jgi:hypothetical protein
MNNNFYLDTVFEGELAFLGSHVTKDVKHSLAERARARGLSVSLLVCEILSRMLVKQGHPFAEAK